ncbi:hypothetical protein VAR608DRAFT_5757 [Variovorax sp. HW608]|uniref:hypothetical protein n=1 Tax=Variovorax sp. HW608 TaxID=1034889 RepID=UPI00081FAE67|nr:hypothetical protein [Variovorax sp. HW608]SCK55727.1 hypothetical protein VAR608DRAFT_5757 [Variovorax sp. HW608]
MKGNELFIELVLRLKHFADAAVLWILIKERADVKEFKTSAVRMAYDQLPGTIDRNAAQRAFKSLQDRGLIRVRIHRKTATMVTVNREAVFDLLDSELEERLPGLSKHEFPFLEAWDTERALPQQKRQAASNPPSNAQINEVILSNLEQSSDYDDH